MKLPRKIAIFIGLIPSVANEVRDRLVFAVFGFSQMLVNVNTEEDYHISTNYRINFALSSKAELYITGSVWEKPPDVRSGFQWIPALKAMFAGIWIAVSLGKYCNQKTTEDVKSGREDTARDCKIFPVQSGRKTEGDK
ncbi:MAG: hypothetical protein LBJ17_01500 [Dysgonamonadaceae bacterium]|jgi:hypothetical protein|nr:hypothetical protein [Dysgonamonadaceae bacterium]